jgi:hydrogenase expression/formation protein HypD
MKYIDEFRNQGLVQDLARRLAALASGPATVMEVCGTHTMAAARFGLKSLLPPGVQLISGPGCPVCVTAASDLDAFLALGSRRTVRRLGDMPGPRFPQFPGGPTGPGRRRAGGLLSPGRGGTGAAEPG